MVVYSHYPYYPWLQDNYKKLIASYETNHLPHAVIFSGQEGLGKLELAQDFSKIILCAKNTKTNSSNLLQACGKCQNCHLFNLGHHADFKLVQPEEKSMTIKIDQVRKISEFVQHTSQRGEYKIIIIHLAEQLNIAGANALLKSLEEPQGRTLFILITEKISSLLPTLLSRCQKIDFQTPSHTAAKSWLLNLDNKLDAKRLDLALYLSSNSPLEAKIILESEQDIIFKNFIKDLVNYFCKNKSIIDFSEAWHKSDLSVTINFMQLFIIFLIKKMANHHNDSSVFELSDNILNKIFANYNYKALLNIYKKTLEIKQALIKKISLNNQFALERVLLD